MNAEPVIIKFVVEGEVIQQAVTEAAAWNLLNDLHEVFGLPMPAQRSEQAERLKVLVD